MMAEALFHSSIPHLQDVMRLDAKARSPERYTWEATKTQ